MNRLRRDRGADPAHFCGVAMSNDGEDPTDEAGVEQEPETIRRIIKQEQLLELVADSLDRHNLQPLAHVPDRRYDSVVGHEPMAGNEARRPQHAQRIVSEGDCRVERCAQQAGRQVLAATVGIEDLPVGSVDGYRVDCEVAAGEILLDVITERHLGLCASASRSAQRGGW